MEGGGGGEGERKWGQGERGGGAEREIEGRGSTLAGITDLWYAVFGGRVAPTPQHLTPRDHIRSSPEGVEGVVGEVGGRKRKCEGRVNKVVLEHIKIHH